MADEPLSSCLKSFQIERKRGSDREKENVKEEKKRRNIERINKRMNSKREGEKERE